MRQLFGSCRQLRVMRYASEETKEAEESSHQNLSSYHDRVRSIRYLGSCHMNPVVRLRT